MGSTAGRAFAALLPACLWACPAAPSAGVDGSDADGDTEGGLEAWLPESPDIPWLDAGEPPVAPPVLTPCPPGWREAPPSDPGGVAACDPWPDADPAAPPVLTPCPPGWREIADAGTGLITCDPWPAGGPIDCAPDEAHFPGEPGCSRVGTECPAGDWSDDLPSTGVLYVRAGAPPGGTGTRASPFGTIAEATAAAAPGAVIAIGRGTFEEEVALGEGVTLRGACVAETVVAASTPSDTAGTITVAGTDAAVRNLRVAGGRSGIWVDGSLSVDLEDVVVAGAESLGVFVWGGGAVTGRNVVVRDTRSRASDGLFGRGIGIGGGSRVELNRSLVWRNGEVGIAVMDPGSTLTLSDVAVRDTLPDAAGEQPGIGLVAQAGPIVEATRSAFEGNRSLGVFAWGAGTTLALTDSVVRDTRSRDSDGEGGRGIHADAGARVVAARTLVERNREVAVSAQQAGTVLELEDVVVRDTAARASDGIGGVGLNLLGGAEADVSRAVFERNREIGAYVADARSLLRLADVVVRDTMSVEADGSLGRGIEADDGGRVEAIRAVFERNRDSGVWVFGAGTSASLEDVIVRHTEGRALDSRFGMGFVATEGATADLTRVLLDRNRHTGAVAAGSGTTLALADVVIRDTDAEEADGSFGRGLTVQDGARADVSRASFERNRDIGMLAARAGTALTATDVLVQGTLGRRIDGLRGRGLHVQEGARADATRALFERNSEGGVAAGGSGTVVALTDVAVRDTLGSESALQTGFGLLVGDGARTSVSRAAVERNGQFGLVASGPGTLLTVADAVVRDTVGEPDHALFGRGLQAQDGARVEAAGVLFERNREIGVLAAGPGTAVSMTDAVVRDTLERECASDDCLGFGAGTGVSVLAEAAATLARFVVSGNVLCGIQLAHGSYGSAEDLGGGTADLHEGEVSGNTIGVNIQAEGFDVGRLIDRVVYRDNGRNLDSADLPTPSARMSD